MNNTTLKDIQKLAEMLQGIREIREIKFSQKIVEGRNGADFNHIKFIHKIRGVYFYTDKSKLETLITKGANVELPTYIGYEGTDSIYEIK